MLSGVLLKDERESQRHPGIDGPAPVSTKASSPFEKCMLEGSSVYRLDSHSRCHRHRELFKYEENASQADSGGVACQIFGSPGSPTVESGENTCRRAMRQKQSSRHQKTIHHKQLVLFELQIALIHRCYVAFAPTRLECAPDIAAGECRIDS